jgi:chromosome segregation ATPase
MNSTIERHSIQLDDIQNTLKDVMIKIELIVNDYQHLYRNVDNISDSLKTIPEVDYTVKTLQGHINLLQKKIEDLDSLLIKHQVSIKDLEEKANRLPNAVDFVRKNWVWLVPCMSALAFCWDYVSKLFPHLV